MNDECYYRLDRVSIVDVSGVDAVKILHNLTTNEVKSLEVGCGRETFVTDVRGKTLGHCHLYRQYGHYRLIGAAGQSQRIAAQVDRYTIREDATAVVRDDELAAVALGPAAIPLLGLSLSPAAVLSHTTVRLGDLEAALYQTRWLGEPSAVLLVAASLSSALGDALAGRGLLARDAVAFHHARTLAGFPWMGIDLDESNLPQEADRDALAISFTKGCYLGQETVARLDALGQVQKRLVGWSLSGAIPEPGAALVSGEKTVGRLTSIADCGQGSAVAIGMARRSHFESGASATGVTASGAPFTGTVR
jgi:hypothetical protein